MISQRTLRRNLLIVVAATTMVSAGSVYSATQLPVKEPAAVSANAGEASERIVVRYKDGTSEASLQSAKLSALQSAMTRAGGKAAAVKPTYLRKLATGADLMRLPGALSKSEVDKVVSEIAADPTVEYASVDRRMYAVKDLKSDSMVTPQFVPNDTYYAGYQWHYSDATGGIGAPAAWDVSQGAGVVVAVLDTGILYDHPDFAGTDILEGYDFISDADVSRRGTDDRAPGALDYGDWVASDNECYTGSEADTSSWHGTHVAGTVAETTNNGIGMAGVAYEATVLPVRVLGKCGGYTSDIADAIIWASGGHVDGVPDNTNPADVISMSLGGSGSCDSLTQDAIDEAVANGATVVVAAGNESDNAANHSPASCDNVITVGATRITGGITSYSNYGSDVDIAAPGGGGSVDGNPGGYIWQAWYDGETTPTSGSYTYVGYGGTSMSTPHVAATVALVQSAVVAAGMDPLTPSAMETLLKNTARAFPVTPPTSTPIGAGIVDAASALESALEVPCDPETEDCTPDATPLTNRVAVGGLSGSAGDELVFSFEASGNRTLTIMTYGGSGNVSLYASYGEIPSASSYDAKSTRSGNSETIRFTAPQTGTYYITLVGEAAYSGVTIVARQ